MPRVPGLRRLPWAIALEVAIVAREHWQLLDERDRAELARIVRKSKGKPANLTERERRHLRELVAKLDLVTAGRSLLPFGRRRRRRR